jgi:hypothetical protein
MIRTGGLLAALAVAATGIVVTLSSGAVPSGATAGLGSEVASNDSPPPRRHGTSRHIAGRAGLAVDLVKLKSGTTLRGAIARSGPDGSLTMAVARDWLRTASPALFAREAGAEASVRRAALEQLRDRLNQEQAGLPEDSRLAAFLRSERKRVEKLLAPTAAPGNLQFVWLEVTKPEIAKIKPAGAGNRRIAAWSWYERLAHVESRDANDLARQLQRTGIDPAQPLPDLSDRFPLRKQDDREWRARMAVVVYALGKPLDFQGTGDFLVPVDRPANAKDAEPPSAKLIADQANAQLKELLGAGSLGGAKPASPDAWLQPAYREAERRKARGFRATRVDLNLAGRQASVYSLFAVYLGHGDWAAIWSDRETQDGAKARADLEAVIADDPQVKEAVGHLSPLGATADAQVGQAIRMGAATAAAQQAVDRRFFEFEGPLLQHLDGPPLW